MRKIKNYCSFVIKGLNQERFFNEMLKSSFVYDVNRYDKNKTSFKVPIKNYRKVKKFILSSGFEILGEKKRGWLYRLFSLRKNYGLIAGIVFMLTLYFCQLPVVWQVKVNGVAIELQKKMSSYVAENFSTKKREIDCKEIEISLRNEFENLSFVSVAVIGQSLVINAKEGATPNEMTGTFEPIKANTDCRVKKIKLIQGTLAVEVGDTIQKGDVIVYPYIIDSFGEQKKVEPKAEIIVECWLEGFATHMDEEYVLQRTGKIYEEQKIYLFGLEIYTHGSKQQFSNYEIESSKKFFSKNNILPLMYKKIVYYETEYILQKINYEHVRNEKINQAREKALQNASKYDIITQERYLETYNNGINYISYFVTIEKEISVK